MLTFINLEALLLTRVKRWDIFTLKLRQFNKDKLHGSKVGIKRFKYQ
jgi:hypothetical protein